MAPGSTPRWLTGPYSRQRQFGVDAPTSTAASATAALALSGDQAVWSEPATASLSLTGSTAWSEPASGSLALSATSVSSEPATGALTLAATGAWTELATAVLSLAGTAAWNVPVAATVSLTGTATPVGTSPTGTATMNLTGAAAWVQLANAALALTTTSAVTATDAATALLLLTSTVSAVGRAAAGGALNLSAGAAVFIVTVLGYSRSAPAVTQTATGAVGTRTAARTDAVAAQSSVSNVQTVGSSNGGVS